jgi:hypothetical protein
MMPDEASHLLLVHGAGAPTDDGDCELLEDGMLGMLRPYRGLVEANYHAVMRALLVLAASGGTVDRRVVRSVWMICERGRAWGVAQEGLLRRNGLIAPADVAWLDRALSDITETALGWLAETPPGVLVERYAAMVVEHGPGSETIHFLPWFIEALEDPAALEPTPVARALARLGPAAAAALPALLAARERSWPDYCER